MGKAVAKHTKQVAALPVMRGASGLLRVLLITSRETKRLIIPKGWPMKGLKDCDAAATEAREEAGVIGRVSAKPLGSYTYWKRCTASFALIKADVYLLEVTRQLDEWREKGQRESFWLGTTEAADLLDEADLAGLVRALPERRSA